ncbi:MAG: TetR/AcrR family transcriptional regulator [Deltaproteobacteria bacterium]|nr:TetR/AcrR family transcriptional regulator [Deltaproteobacteria bacterium]
MARKLQSSRRSDSPVSSEASSEERSPTKERILDSAEELFAQKGFDGARTRDIAARASVNISTLHFHCKSKEDLYTAVYQRQIARRTALAGEVLAVFSQAGDSPDRWSSIAQAIVTLLFDFFRRYPHAARLDSYRLLEDTAPHSTLQQGQALLFSVAEQLRNFLPKDLAPTADVALNILSVNALLREYFASPEVFGQLLGESDRSRLEARLHRHVQQHVTRLFRMLEASSGQPAATAER